MMIRKEQILSFVRRNGPTIPNQLKKEFGGDTTIFGAILSEMTQAHQLKVSNTKIGGSPAYYIPGEAYKLQNLFKYLNEKDKRAYELLKSKKILRDKALDPLMRVALRNIKDFAKPLEVNLKGQTHLFWKWYLVKNESAEPVIKRMLGITAPAPPTTSPPPKKTVEVKKQIPPKPIEKKIVKPLPVKTEKKPVQSLPVQKKVVVPSQTIKTVDDTIKDPFLKKLIGYFEEKRILIVDKKILRKNSDIELKITLPTTLGRVEYYCKAKNKKKCNDGDLSSAYLQGQAKKLPVLFITTGEVTKKSKDKLNSEFKGLILKEI